jgi:cyclase
MNNQNPAEELFFSPNQESADIAVVEEQVWIEVYFLMCMRTVVVAVSALLLGSASGALAAPQVQQLGPNLYAYISDNDHSSNSTFLVGRHGILVVDTGLNGAEGQKLLAAIRRASRLPVQFIITTHYHPDHQGGNAVVGPEAVVVSSPFTREQTQQMIRQVAQREQGKVSETSAAFRLATVTVARKLTIYLDDDPVEIFSPGPAHTEGDLYVYFPNQKTVSTGDVYMTNSCPAMDQGSADNWVHALDAILALPAEHFVPGHFEVGTRSTVQRFRDYLRDLDLQVAKLYRSGASVDEIRQRIDMSKYKGFRQFPQFHATFADNAEAIYYQLRHSQ